MNKHTFLAVAIGLSLAASAAFAQIGGSPARLRGKIDAVSGETLKLTLRNGTKASAKLPDNVRVTWLTVANASEIQPGSYVGTAAVPQPDGSLKALEVQVFPPSMRGVGEGTRAWDLGSQSSMTNGTVGSLVAANGRTITITYKGGEKRVVVPDDVPIVTYEPADKAALTPGANVLINGTRAADGTVTASSVSVGKNALVPPM
ncbi:MAG TPA: DUF5666 domain-containing protein [Acetobacteraceae bacterium]|nr:DUF5666 domain-containing protein [Acetobacteraceae bacterium]